MPNEFVGIQKVARLVESAACRGLERGAIGKTGRKRNNAPRCSDANKRKSSRGRTHHHHILRSSARGRRGGERNREHDWLPQPRPFSPRSERRFPRIWGKKKKKKSPPGVSLCQSHAVQSQKPRQATNEIFTPLDWTTCQQCELLVFQIKLIQCQLKNFFNSLLPFFFSPTGKCLFPPPLPVALRQALPAVGS